MRIRKIFPLLLLGVLLYISGCTHVMSKESRKLADADVPFEWIAQNPEHYKGVMVILGGKIIETQNVKEGTHIIVLQKLLGYSEEPLLESNSGGRFLVLYEGFLDPAVYEKGKLITIAGIIEGEKVLPLDEVEYHYPYINAREIHLWKITELMQVY